VLSCWARAPWWSLAFSPMATTHTLGASSTPTTLPGLQAAAAQAQQRQSQQAYVPLLSAQMAGAPSGCLQATVVWWE
jgi:hypothetical protein